MCSRTSKPKLGVLATEEGSIYGHSRDAKFRIKLPKLYPVWLTRLSDQGLGRILARLGPNSGVLQRPAYGAHITIGAKSMLIRALMVQLASLLLSIVAYVLISEGFLLLSSYTPPGDVMVMLVLLGELFRMYPTSILSILLALATAYIIYRRIVAYLSRKGLFGYAKQVPPIP